MTDPTTGRSAGRPENPASDPTHDGDVGAESRDPTRPGEGAAERDPTAGGAAGTPENPEGDPTRGREAGSPANPATDPTRG